MLALLGKSSCSPETLVEYIDREVIIEVPEPKAEPCKDPACEQKAETHRNAIIAESDFVCQDEGCTEEKTKSDNNVIKITYDNNIWANWYARGGAYYEIDEADVDNHTFTTTVGGKLVRPCFNDADRAKAKTATNYVTNAFHPDPNCDGTHNCHAMMHQSSGKAHYESLDRCEDEGCDSFSITSHYVSVGVAHASGRNNSWFERNGKYHETPTGSNMGVVKLPGTDEFVHPCYNNADRRAAEAAARARIEQLHPSVDR